MRRLSDAVLAILLCAAWMGGVSSANAAPRVLISEVMSSDNTAFADEDGDCEDWIELVNAGDAAAPLAGMPACRSGARRIVSWVLSGALEYKYWLYWPGVTPAR